MSDPSGACRNQIAYRKVLCQSSSTSLAFSYFHKQTEMKTGSVGSWVTVLWTLLWRYLYGDLGKHKGSNWRAVLINCSVEEIEAARSHLVTLREVTLSKQGEWAFFLAGFRKWCWPAPATEVIFRIVTWKFQNHNDNVFRHNKKRYQRTAIKGSKPNL